MISAFVFIVVDSISLADQFYTIDIRIKIERVSRIAIPLRSFEPQQNHGILNRPRHIIIQANKQTNKWGKKSNVMTQPNPFLPFSFESTKQSTLRNSKIKSSVSTAKKSKPKSKRKKKTICKHKNVIKKASECERIQTTQHLCVCVHKSKYNNSFDFI